MSRINIIDKDKFRLGVLKIRNAIAFRHNISQTEADMRLLEQLGLSLNSKPHLLQVWTQVSRLSKITTVDDQYFCTLAWLGFILLDRNLEWLNEFIGSVDIGGVPFATNPAMHSFLKFIFGKVRLNGVSLEESLIEKELAQIFRETDNSADLPLAGELEYGFQINQVFTNYENHLYLELCGTTRTPILFCVKNETTGRTWQALGSRLTGYCKPYRVIWDISSPSTWYAIDIMCHEETYGAHVYCLTNDVRPYFCDDIRIEGPYHNFKRRVILTPPTD